MFTTRITALKPSILKGLRCLHVGKIFQAEAKGQIAVRTPAKVSCEAGKTYTWCACGLSGKQPFCDGSHVRSPAGITPITWQPKVSKDYMFCQCKQTSKRPLCDGTHLKL